MSRVLDSDDVVISLPYIGLDSPPSGRCTILASMARYTTHRNGERLSYYRTAQVARILGISTRTLFRKLKAGEFPEPRRDPANNYRLWTLSEIELFDRLMKG